MSIKAIIFDMDGVITDSEKPYINMFPSLCKENRYIIDSSDIKNTLGTSYEYSKKYFIDKLGDQFPYDKIFADFEKMLIDMAYDGRLKLKSNVLETLIFLKNNRIKIALASSNTSNAVYSYLDAFDIKKYFDVILTGDDIINSKPNPEIFLKALNKLQVSPDEAIIVEDSINGIIAAKNTNAISVMIPDLIPYNDKLKNYVDYCFNNVYDVIKLL